jgi:acyl-coenzyme A thioesterase PaaI-like protein
MIDESFSRVTNAIRPPGRSIVTSELSIDLVEMAGSGDSSLSCDANAVAVSPTAALAHSTLQDAHGAVVATASTWCRFINGGHDENHAYPQAAKPPPDLALHHLLTTTLSPDDSIVMARFTPDDQCTNDLGTLHGGVAAAAALEVGLTWLRMIYGEALAAQRAAPDRCHAHPHRPKHRCHVRHQPQPGRQAHHRRHCHRRPADRRFPEGLSSPTSARTFR